MKDVLSTRTKAAIVGRLLAWFEKNRRSFPWRDTFERPDPYLILFTEIMLQRTKADQVVPVYSEFVRRYPTFHELRKAPRREVANLFARLGLTWRAKRVVELIQVLDKRFGGDVPRDLEELKKLPAVGDYVAKAVMCYAFGKATAPVDSNVVRVTSRLFGLPISGDSARRNPGFLELTLRLLPLTRAADFNLALLDLGANICKTRPLCSLCPLQLNCEYYSKLKGDGAVGLKPSKPIKLRAPARVLKS